MTPKELGTKKFLICGDYLCWINPNKDCKIYYLELDKLCKDG